MGIVVGASGGKKTINRKPMAEVINDLASEGVSVEVVPEPKLDVEAIKNSIENMNTTPREEQPVDEEPKEIAYSLGNPNGYVYLDVELEELTLGTQAVKIAVMTQGGDIFFGHITDDEELKKQNVLEGKIWQVYGSKKLIAAQFNFWLNEYFGTGATQCVQFVCNVSTYKFPAFIDIITNGEGIGKLQSWITPVCYDLTIDICNSVCAFNDALKEYPVQSAFMLDNRALLFTIKGEDFEIKADEKVVNDVIITSIIHKFIWNLP